MVKSYIVLEKTENSDNFRTNHNVSCKQGWVFGHLQNIQSLVVFALVCTRKKEKGVYVEKDKTKILRAVLAEVSVYFEGAGKFIQERVEEICAQEKISVEKVIYLLVLWYVVSLPLTLKTEVYREYFLLQGKTCLIY